MKTHTVSVRCQVHRQPCLLGLRLGRGGPLALVVAHTQYPDEHDRDLRNGEKAPDACLLIQVIREPCSHRRSSEEEKKSKDLPRPDIGLI